MNVHTTTTSATDAAVPEHEAFRSACRAEVAAQAADRELRALSSAWLVRASERRYSYHFRACGLPIIQFPQDIVALQELLWEVQPDLVVETGVARGGSLVMYASQLVLHECAAAAGAAPAAQPRRVLGIDIHIRPENRAAIEAHPFGSRIELIEGSSVDPTVVAKVHARAAQAERVLVCLDSNHTHSHVLAELMAYAPLVALGSYLVVFDTVVEHLPKALYPDRPWGPGDNPLTAVREFLAHHPEFEVDRSIDQRLLLTVAPEGFLKRVR